MEAKNQKPILLVEDEESIRENLQLLLDMEGYDVTTAANGEEALAALNCGGPGLPKLILLDLMMPVMDGFRFREIQKTLPHAADIPIVVISADGNVKVKQEKIEAQGYLRKPLDIYQLLEIIAKFF